MRPSALPLLALAGAAALCAAVSGADTQGFLVTASASPIFAGPGSYYETVTVLPAGFLIEVPRAALVSPRPWMPVTGFPDGRERFEELMRDQGEGDMRRAMWVSVRNVKARSEVNEELFRLAVSPMVLGEAAVSHAIRGFANWIAATPAGKAMPRAELERALEVPFSPAQFEAFRNLRAAARPRRAIWNSTEIVERLDCLSATQVGLHALNKLSKRLGGTTARHDALERYVNLVAAYLADRSVCYDRRFRVILWEHDEVLGAYSTPGGFIVLTTRLLEQCRNEAELAGLLAHEMAHVHLEHGLKVEQYAQAATGIISPFELENELDRAVEQVFGVAPEWHRSNYEQLEDMAAALLEAMLLKQYLVADERAADEFAAVALYNSGYEPRALGRLLSRLGKASLPQGFLTSHGPVRERVDALSSAIESLHLSNPRAKRFESEYREATAARAP